jgi:hypothetical protein
MEKRRRYWIRGGGNANQRIREEQEIDMNGGIERTARMHNGQVRTRTRDDRLEAAFLLAHRQSNRLKLSTCEMEI